MSRRKYQQDPQQKRVRVYDLESKQVSTIPARELAPGMVRANFSGKGNVGQAWVSGAALAAKLQPGPYRIKPFDEQTRDYLREIKAALDDVYPMSLEEWEDGFRRDENVEREIVIWLRVAKVYKQFTGDVDRGAEYRKSVFGLLASCFNSPRAHILDVAEMGVLARPEAENIIAAFYGKPPAAPTAHA